MKELIRTFVQNRVDELEQVAVPPTQIGLKISYQMHNKLVTVAKELEMSKTALANKLLAYAIDEAFEQLNMKDGDEEDE